MAQIVKLRRSAVTGNKPTTSQLELGELAMNTYDGKIYFERSGSGGESIEEILITNAQNTGSLSISGSSHYITGSLNLSGSLLLPKIVKDYTNSTGSVGQILQSTIDGVEWVNNVSAGAEGRSVVQQFEAATTWSLVHNLGEQYPTLEVYDSNNQVIIPSTITATSISTLTITFAVPVAGTATATVGGGLPIISGSFNGYILMAVSGAASWQPSSVIVPSSASYALDSDKLDGKHASEFAVTGSNTFIGVQTISGSINFSSGSIITGLAQYSGAILLQPVEDPDPNNLSTTGTHLFVSSSNNQTGQDLYFRQQDNKVKWKWIEGKLNSGILYGGALSYSGSTIYVTAGTGIVIDQRASLNSEISPITHYVTWNDITASCANLTSSLATYVYIDVSGSLHQQNSFFTVNQYRDAIPLGMFNHTNKTIITSVANNVVTAFDDVNQTTNFIQAFGPLKLGGLSITPLGTTLGLQIEAGQSYILGGFYQQDPNDASHKTTSQITSPQIARVRRNGAGGFTIDNNNGSFYTTIDTAYWDDGDGTLSSMTNNDWQIQRVFFNPFTTRCHIYYGQTTYSSIVNALQYLATDSFVEADYSSHQYVFLGYLVVKGNTSDLSDTANNRVVQSGLFRNTVGSSGGSAQPFHLHDLADVEVASPSNGDTLIYDVNSDTWIHGKGLSGEYSVTGSLTIDGGKLDSSIISNITAATTIYSISVTSYDGAFFDYVVKSGSNLRAGTVMAAWSGSSVTFAETTTTDLGSTTALAMSVDINSGNARLRATPASGTWTVKSIIRTI
jgi:hypothetical protein